jgi:NADP-dependent 3-hydroxy acid dehydrogenase YdfG
MRSLQNEVFIITGAGGAIAGSVAEAFAKAGADLVLVDRDKVRLQGLASSLGMLAIEADVGTIAGAEAMVRETQAQLGKVDGLVHLVGELMVEETRMDTAEAYDRIFDSNVRSLVYAVRAVLPGFLARGEGFIGGIASREAWDGGAAGSSLFAAAKSAVGAYLTSLDAELQGTQIDVSIVYPMGPVDTPSNSRLFKGYRRGRFIDPRRVAEAFLWAASRDEGGRLLEIPIYPPRQGADTNV